MTYDPRSPERRTLYNEAVQVNRASAFHFKSTWGPSRYRDNIITNGDAAVVEEDGEFKLSSGTSNNQTAALETLQRGQYEAGTSAETGIGVRIPVLPTGTQTIDWGYFDDGNGFGWRIKADGAYIFVRRDGVDVGTERALNPRGRAAPACPPDRPFLPGPAPCP